MGDPMASQPMCAPRRAARPLRRAAAAFVVAVAATAVPVRWATANPGAAPPSTSAEETPASPAPPGVQPGTDHLTVLSQTPWVESSGYFRLRLGVSASEPGQEELVVQGHGRLTTRSAFDDALAGRFDTPLEYPVAPLSLSSLRHDADGGVDVSIPVNQAGVTGDLPEFTASSVGGSGVFPIQVSLASPAGVPLGQPVTVFLVYAAGTAKQTGLPSLAVSVVLPIYAPPQLDRSGSLTAPADSSSGDLSNVVGAVASYPNVPISLAVTPETLDALGVGSAVDKATLGALAAVARSGSDQVLPETYADVSMSGLVDLGLGGELNQQITAGSAALAAVLGSPPSSATWVVDQPLDPATLRLLQAAGAKRLILPASELSAVPTAYQQLTFALPSVLVGGTGPLPVYGADSGLTGDVANAGDPVLAASQLLAEMAMIQLETPGNTRGVAVLPPPGWMADPLFVRTLLAGLAGHPLLRAVTASQLFSVPTPTPPIDRTLAAPPSTGPAPTTASGSAGGSASSTSSTSTTPTTTPAQSATAQLAGQARAIRADRKNLLALSSIFGSRGAVSTRVAVLSRQLLTAESVDISPGQRSTLLSIVRRESQRFLTGISLPAASITLTSTTGQIPLTVLASPGLRATVVLRMQSQRLIFRPFRATCQIPQPTEENCTLTLTAQNTTLKIPVEARSSGVFPLEVALWSPDGSVMLLQHRLTIRSTAVSGVGIVLIVLAILSLAVWWVRDLYHGRRPRELVPVPLDEEAGDEGPAVDGPGIAGRPVEPMEPVDPVEPVESLESLESVKGHHRRRAGGPVRSPGRHFRSPPPGA